MIVIRDRAAGMECFHAWRNVWMSPGATLWLNTIWLNTALTFVASDEPFRVLASPGMTVLWTLSVSFRLVPLFFGTKLLFNIFVCVLQKQTLFAAFLDRLVARFIDSSLFPLKSNKVLTLEAHLHSYFFVAAQGPRCRSDAFRAWRRGSYSGVAVYGGVIFQQVRRADLRGEIALI